MSDFLVSHYQRVDLNDQTAKLSPVNAEVHRFLFLIIANELLELP